jgi:hypothetical protein
MKTTQVVSGSFLGFLLLLSTPSVKAQVAFDDGGVHTITDDSLKHEVIEVRNGTTLHLDAGAVIGNENGGSGWVVVFDNSLLVIGGAQVGGAGLSSGVIIMMSESQLIIENGHFGGSGAYSGQIAVIQQASVLVNGGSFGDEGFQSGLLNLDHQSTAELRGGAFGGSEGGSGWVAGQGASELRFIACEMESIEGPITEAAGIFEGMTAEGTPLSIPFMRAPTATVLAVVECDGAEDADSDGDGVMDEADACPMSDLRSTIWVKTIDTGIPNQIAGLAVDADGCSLADHLARLMERAAEQSNNHGQYVRTVSHGLREFLAEGWIPQAVHGRILNCVARSR